MQQSVLLHASALICALAQFTLACYSTLVAHINKACIFLAGSVARVMCLASVCRILSPDVSCPRALIPQQGFSGKDSVNATWNLLTMSFPREPDAASAMPVLAQLPDLPEDLGQMTGVALLEILCALMEPRAAAKTGAAA